MALREDANRCRKGSIPRVLASFANLALTILRMGKATNIPAVHAESAAEEQAGGEDSAQRAPNGRSGDRLRALRGHTKPASPYANRREVMNRSTRELPERMAALGRCIVLL